MKALGSAASFGIRKFLGAGLLASLLWACNIDPMSLGFGKLTQSHLRKLDDKTQLPKAQLADAYPLFLDNAGRVQRLEEAPKRIVSLSLRSLTAPI